MSASTVPTSGETVPEARAAVPVPGVAALADPGPLGLAAFALTTFLLSFANAGILPGAAVASLGLAIFYGGLGQLIAGVFELVKGNTFGATAFVSYGGFWLAFWYLLATGGDREAGLGVALFLIAFGIFTLYMTVAALRTSSALLAVFAALTLTFFALGFGAMGAGGLTVLGGYLGIITALLAWYASFAGVVNSTFKRVVLPVGPRA